MEKENKKEGFKVEIKMYEDKIMKLKDILSFLKFISILGIILCSIVSVTIVALCTLTALTVSTSTSEQLLKNDSAIDYIAKINSYSISEATDIIGNVDNKAWFITFNVILPSIIVLGAFISLIVFSKKLFDFIKDVKSNKTLFTPQKLNALKILREILLIAGILFVIEFHFQYFIIYFILEIALEIILYLFNYCVESEISKAAN